MNYPTVYAVDKESSLSRLVCCDICHYAAWISSPVSNAWCCKAWMRPATEVEWEEGCAALTCLVENGRAARTQGYWPPRLTTAGLSTSAPARALS